MVYDGSISLDVSLAFQPLLSLEGGRRGEVYLSLIHIFFLAAKSGGYPKKKAVFGRVIEYLLWIYVWFYAAWGPVSYTHLI